MSTIAFLLPIISSSSLTALLLLSLLVLGDLVEGVLGALTRAEGLPGFRDDHHRKINIIGISNYKFMPRVLCYLN